MQQRVLHNLGMLFMIKRDAPMLFHHFVALSQSNVAFFSRAQFTLDQRWLERRVGKTARERRLTTSLPIDMFKWTVRTSFVQLLHLRVR